MVVGEAHHLRKHPYMRFINVYHGLAVLHIVSKLVEYGIEHVWTLVEYIEYGRM